jgi:hypothetical protein
MYVFVCWLLVGDLSDSVSLLCTEDLLKMGDQVLYEKGRISCFSFEESEGIFYSTMSCNYWLKEMPKSPSLPNRV